MNYTQTLKSQMSKYVTLKVLQFTLRKKSGCLGGGCDVYLSLYLDPARTISLIPRCVLCMAEKSTWNKSPVLLQDKRKGQCFVYLRCEGECGLGSVFHRLCGQSLRFPFPLFLFVLPQAKRL